MSGVPLPVSCPKSRKGLWVLVGGPVLSGLPSGGNLPAGISHLGFENSIFLKILSYDLQAPKGSILQPIYLF